MKNDGIRITKKAAQETLQNPTVLIDNDFHRPPIKYRISKSKK